MIILLAILFVILLYGARRQDFNPAYLSKAETDSWKGFFAVIILFSHMLSYMKGLSGPLDRSFAYIIHQTGQMMVVPFLFFSGYGILESYKTKEGYGRNFLRRRFLPVLVHFDIAVALFLITGLLTGATFPARNYILCWTGWESIGNSNWFVFVILMLYLCCSAAFPVSRGNSGKAAAVTTVLALVLWAALKYIFPEKGSYWYNTIWSFPLGMAYSHFKKEMEGIIGSGKGASHNATLAIAATLLLFAICSVGTSNSILHDFKSCFFALLLTALSMKLAIGNKALSWLGRHCFSIYILQRLPMNLMSIHGINESRPYLFAAVSISTALLLAWGFTKLTDIIDRYALKVK